MSPRVSKEERDKRRAETLSLDTLLPNGGKISGHRPLLDGCRERLSAAESRVDELEGQLAATALEHRGLQGVFTELRDARSRVDELEAVQAKVCRFALEAIPWEQGEGLHAILGAHPCWAATSSFRDPLAARSLLPTEQETSDD